MWFEIHAPRCGLDYANREHDRALTSRLSWLLDLLPHG
jgi:hypothetical protein